MITGPRLPSMRRRPPGAVGVRRVEQEGQQVAVAGEPGAQRAAHAREDRAVAQQQVRRAEGAGAEHQLVAGDPVQRLGAGAGRPALVGRVVDRRSAPRSRRRAAARSRAPRSASAGPRRGAPRPTGRCGRGCSSPRRCSRCRTRRTAGRSMRGRPCTFPYAGVGIGAPGTGGSWGRPAKVTASGGSCQSRPSRAALSRMRGVLAVAGYGYGVAPEHLLDPVVVRVEVGAAQRPALVAAARHRRLLHEPLLVLAQQDVRVDQRAAAETAGHHALEAAERPDVEQALHALARVPEVAAHRARGAGEAARRVGLAALQQDDGAARLRQPVRSHRTAEPGPDDHRVRVLVVCLALGPPGRRRPTTLPPLALRTLPAREPGFLTVRPITACDK